MLTQAAGEGSLVQSDLQVRIIIHPQYRSSSKIIALVTTLEIVLGLPPVFMGRRDLEKVFVDFRATHGHEDPLRGTTFNVEVVLHHND